MVRVGIVGVCGRRLFDLTHGWSGRHPVGVPVFVVTHAEPEDWPHRDAPFTFVTDGVASAPIALEGPGVVEGEGVTHLYYRVRRDG